MLKLIDGIMSMQSEGPAAAGCLGHETYQYANPLGPKSRDRICDSADMGVYLIHNDKFYQKNVLQYFLCVISIYLKLM